MPFSASAQLMPSLGMPVPVAPASVHRHPIPGRAVGVSAMPKAGGVTVRSGLMEPILEPGHKSE